MNVSAATCTELIFVPLACRTKATGRVQCCCTFAATNAAVEGCRQLDTTLSSFWYQKWPNGPATWHNEIDVAASSTLTIAFDSKGGQCTYEGSSVSCCESSPSVVVSKFALPCYALSLLGKAVSGSPAIGWVSYKQDQSECIAETKACIAQSYHKIPVIRASVLIGRRWRLRSYACQHWRTGFTDILQR